MFNFIKALFVKKKGLTEQEIFDTVVSHLMTQRVQSADESGDCLYRGPDGLSCAVGCLIPDDLYDVKMDVPEFDSGFGTGITSIIDQFNFPKYFHENIDLLVELQRFHDSNTSFGASEYTFIQLEDLARRNNVIFDRNKYV